MWETATHVMIIVRVYGFVPEKESPLIDILLHGFWPGSNKTVNYDFPRERHSIKVQAVIHPTGPNRNLFSIRLDLK